jgi:hypothetical protein
MTNPKSLIRLIGSNERKGETASAQKLPAKAIVIGKY